jgi:hypothetical protein
MNKRVLRCLHQVQWTQAQARQKILQALVLHLAEASCLQALVLLKTRRLLQQNPALQTV